MRITEHAPRGPCRRLERRHGLAEIVDALLAYYRPSAAKRLFAQAVTAAVAVAKAIVDAVTVAAPPPPPPTPSPVASEHPESLTF